MIKKIIQFLKFYATHRGELVVTEALQKYYNWRKPVKPYAFIRLHNEIKTVDASLNSILPILQGGVIGFNDCTDGTKEYILDFCKKHPQFIPAEYPYQLIPANDAKYKEDILDPNLRLDQYYNFVWQKLPKNEWIIKVDGDHLWDLDNTLQLCKLLIRKKDCVILSRMNLHCIDNTVYIHKNHPICEPGDSWILYNRGDLKFDFSRGWHDDVFFAWEHLSLPRKKYRKIYGVLCNYHFPIVKHHRNQFDANEWVEFDKFDLNKFIIENDMQGRIPKNMIDKKRILQEFKKFRI